MTNRKVLSRKQEVEVIANGCSVSYFKDNNNTTYKGGGEPMDGTKVLTIEEAADMKTYTVAEAATEVGVSDTALRYLLWRKRIPSHKLGGNIILTEEDMRLVKAWYTLVPKRGRKPTPAQPEPKPQEE